MPMSKHQNKENESFDKKIRMKLEDHPMDFDPAAWEAMEKKLDLEVGNTSMPGQFWKYFGLFGLLLLLSFSGWWLLSDDASLRASANSSEYQQDKEYRSAESLAADSSEGTYLTSGSLGKEIEQQENRGLKQVQAKEEVPQKSARATSVFSEITEPGKVVQGRGSVKEIQEEKENPLETNTGYASIAGNGSISKQKVSGKSGEAEVDFSNKQQQLSPLGFNLSGTNHKRSLEESLDKAFVSIEKETEEAIEVKRNYNDSLNEEAAGDSQTFINVKEKGSLANNTIFQAQKRKWEPLVILGERHSALLAKKAVKLESTASEIVIPEEGIKIRKRSPLSVSFTVAPDFTGTGQRGSSKFGAGVGVFLEYEFLPNWALLSGAFYSQKNYLADNSFSPYGKSLDYRRAPDFIDASCGVIDIPLNLRYYFFNKSRHRVFLSAGASSYMMKSEDYTYVYEGYGYDDYTYSVDDQNKHFLAIYNLSFGYQRSLGQHWSLQLEPFIKVPAKGVGIGAVKLNSIGAFLHLNYKIGR